jgi:hypothetical protein
MTALAHPKTFRFIGYSVNGRQLSGLRDEVVYVRSVGVSGQAALGLKSCNLAIPVSVARLRAAYDRDGWIAAVSVAL